MSCAEAFSAFVPLKIIMIAVSYKVSKGTSSIIVSTSLDIVNDENLV